MDSLISIINQQSNLSSSILNKILQSKRLLIDHVECLELCVGEPEPQIKQSSISTLCKTVTFTTGTILCKNYVPKEKIILRTTLMTAFSSLTAFFAVKTFVRFRNQMIENSLDEFIKSLEIFSNCIKRNIVYFSEIQIMNTMNKITENIDCRQTEQSWECIKAIKEITEILYDITRQLEKNYELSMDIADLYCPMEELRDCDYFKNDIKSFTSKHIKDFYNIFAYVQSQYLFRLALLAKQNFKMYFIRYDLNYLTRIIQKHIKNDEKYFKNLSKIKKNLKAIEISTLNRSIPYHQQKICKNFETEFILKESSLKLSSCIYAVAEECQKLDNTLQIIIENSLDNNIEYFKNNDTNNLIKISNSMKTIENSLSICCDDFHRLILIYNKFLSNKLKLELKDNLKNEKEKFEENNEDDQKIEENEHTEEEKFDDFFGFVEDDDKNINLEKNEKEINDSNEIYNIDEKLTKKKFKPVLKQLRNRIDPIRQEMLEKERKILESKGINVNKLLPDNVDKSNDSDSDGSFDELEKGRKQEKRKDAYEEMRQFLAQKESFNVFQLQLPTNTALSEDILE